MNATTRITHIGTAILPVIDQAEGVEISFATIDATADHAAPVGAGIDTDSELVDMGPGVPPMFTFRDVDGDRFRVVERG